MSSSNTRGAKRTEEEALEEHRLEAVLASLLQLSDNQNRLLCPPFRVLDSKEEFPLYYEHIKSPIDMKMIAAKIRTGHYPSWALFEADIRLMCRNAKAFNEPNSTIHKDASKLQAHCLSKREECLTRKYTSKEMAQNKEIIDELLQQETAHSGEFSEDSEEDEDSENDNDPKWVLYWKVRNYNVVDGNPLCEHFLELPSKSYYPDYYDEIEKPMSLFMINKRLKHNEYPDLKCLVEALLLVFRNARSYNIEESDIYKAANQLEQLTLQTAEALSPGIKAKLHPITEEPNQEKQPATVSSTEDPSSPAPKPALKKGSAGRKAVKRARLSSERSEPGSEAGSSSGPAAPTPVPATTPAKRRRPARDSSPTKSMAEKQKPGRKSLDELREKFTSKLMEVWNVARDLKMGNRLVSDQFYELPCQKKFPDYYTDIAKPIAMTTIKSKIEAAKYVDSTEMLADFAVMCSNARQYNRPDSQIFTDSTILESVVNGTMNSLTQNNTIYYPYKKSDKNWSENASCSLDFSKKYSMQKQKPRTKTPKIQKPSEALSPTHSASPAAQVLVFDTQAAGGFSAPPPPMPDQQQQQQIAKIPRNVSKEQQQMHSVLDALITFRDGQEGRVLSEAFMRLPSRAEYPEYYDVIRKPMDLARVRSKLQQSSQYDSLKALVADLNLVFDNACKFNEPDSQIYKDALTLQKELLEMRSQFYEESNLPSVQTQVRLILTNLLVAVTTYKDSTGKCLCDQLADIHDLLKKNGLASEEWPFSMDQIKNNVDKGRYKRLDRFQEDLFALFTKARQFSEPDSEMFNVAVDLQLYYVERRDELCKGILISPASLILRSTVLEESENLRKEKRLKDKRAGTPADATKLDTGEEDKPKLEKESQDERDPKPELAETEELLDSVENEGLTYYPWEYVYVSDSSSSSSSNHDDTNSKHIMRIEHIIRDKEDKEVVFLKGTWCYKPGETYHKASRMFYPKEVFLTSYKDTITVDRLKGKCCVMFVDDYLKKKPIYFSEADTYVCESRYLGRKLHFKRLFTWPHLDEAIELKTEDRKERLNPAKVVSEFVAGVPEQKFQESDSEEAEESPRMRNLPVVLDVAREEVLERRQAGDPGTDTTTAAGTSVENTYYQQMEFNGQYYRLGDGVMVFREGKPHCEVMRIDKMWQTPSGLKQFSGCVFARPKETKHEQSRMFYKREVVAIEQPDRVESMSLVQNKCAILTVKTFETSRPTEIPECDVFLVDHKVYGPNYNQNPINNKNCSLVAKYSEAVGTENVNAEAEMNMLHARTFRKLKPYNLSSGVIEDEIYYFKTPLILEKELSPQIMSDTSLPIDHSDLDNEAQHLNESLDHSSNSSSAKGGASWLAAQPKLNAKSKSGYILFSAEVRKKIMSENPESGFGEVSKIVGIEWKKLPEENKRQYEIRAQFIAEERAKADLLTPTSKLLQPGQIRVFSCRWQLCDYQFDCQEGLYEHIKSSHTCQIIVDGENQYVCLWTSCLKYRKEGKPFPSMPRLHRHIKEKHLASSSKPIFPNQKSKHFFVYLPPQPNSSHHSSQQSGHFVHQPYGVPSAHAVGCSIATPISSAPAPSPSGHHSQATPSPSSSNQHAPSSSTAVPNGYAPAQYVVGGQHHQSQQQYNNHYASSASSSQHTTVIPVSTTQGGNGSSSNGVHHHQLVQATINGNTVYVPAGAQYQTYVLNQPSVGPPQGGAHQIVVHQSSAHLVQQQQLHPSGGQLQHVTYVQQQHNGGGSNGAGPVLNGLPPGASYVTAPPGSSLHLAGQPTSHSNAVQTGAPNALHSLQQHTSASHAPPSANPSAPATSTAVGHPAPTLQPMIDAGRTVVHAKAPEPVFLAPTNSIQVKRVMHSETYVKYIESLYNSKQKTVSKWDKNLLATSRSISTNHKKLPYDWIKHAANGSGKPKEEEIVKSLWKLREQLLQDTTGIKGKTADVLYQQL